MRTAVRLTYSYRNYGKLSFNPFEKVDPREDPKAIHEAADRIFHWAKDHGARYYSFLAFPHNGAIAEKQETFIQMKFQQNTLMQHLGETRLSAADLLRGEGDGSSFPNGGLRDTANARGYFLWDWKSPVFIRKRNGVLYIPSLLVNHYGQSLDDKTLYRKAESLIEKASKNILKTLGINATKFLIGAGMEQQFFIIPKSEYEKRLDLTQTGRALFGSMPPHNQQFSDHYYGKMPAIIEQILKQAQDQLLQIGVPIKTRHKEVANNQFEFCPVFTEASRAIDQNIMMMKILEEACERKGFVPLWHEKPFGKINGSGKHINWSINYFNEKGEIRNLFKPNAYKDDLFVLFVLLNLKAILNNQQLYLSSVCCPGNEFRLGGHEAPPRIISSFIGENVKNMIEQLPETLDENLRDIIQHLITDLKQENTDRNRTSPYAFTSNRFEFRAVGSTQNAYFPMTIILTTFAEQISKANDRLEAGESLEDLIKSLAEETTNIRFNGNGYSHEWIKEAKEVRKLYVNTEFIENLENIGKFGNVLVRSGVYSQRELQSKSSIVIEEYVNTVKKQVETLLILLNKNIIPRALSEIKNFPLNITSEPILKRNKKLINLVEKLSVICEKLSEVCPKIEGMPLKEVGQIRKSITETGEIVDQVSLFLPDTPRWPELTDILGRY